MKASKTPKTSRSGAKSGSKRGQNKKIDLPADIKDERQFRTGGGSSRRRSADLDKLIQPQKKCDKGDFREDELADRMGLARQYLRDIRKKELTEGKDWVVEGNAVILRNTAINTIIRKLELELSDIPEKAPPICSKLRNFGLISTWLGLWIWTATRTLLTWYGSLMPICSSLIKSSQLRCKRIAGF